MVLAGERVVRALRALCDRFANRTPRDIRTLPKTNSGEDCCHLGNAPALVKMYNASHRRGRTFVCLSHRFRTRRLPMPTIRTISGSKLYCLRSSLKASSLFRLVTRKERAKRFSSARGRLLGGIVQLLPHVRFRKTRKLSFKGYCPTMRFGREDVL